MEESISLSDDLEKLRQGDPVAAERLIEHAYQRLQQMASRMLKSFPTVGRWEETDDIWLATAVPFHRSLMASPPTSLPDFYNLAGRHIRQTLIKLARKHNGPMGLSTNLDTNDGTSIPTGMRGESDPRETGNDPISLAEWEEFHRDIESLPSESREVFDLLWYGGLSQIEAAEILGIHYRSVKRRWRKARVLLYERRSGTSLPT